jgi:Zn-dependent peptidase ImmA (M78 family)
MILAQDTFKKAVKGWNKRIFTEQDFFRLCKRFGVLVFEEDPDCVPGDGAYVVVEDIPVIFINNTLTGLKRLWVMFHELGHHLLHTPETCLFSDSTIHKAQSEANFFAALALLPEQMVRQIPLWEAYDVDEHSAKLLEMRLEFFENYKV